jgi:ABC-type Zn uptake system ZnuABC Zn-binding protein ZnuA
MKIRLSLGVTLLFFLLGLMPRCSMAAGHARVRVVTTLTVLKYLTEQVGGDRVVVNSLSNPNQDPHYVQPRPTLMKLARDADLFVEVGLQLELWAQKVVDGSANSAIQIGQPGRVIASKGISTLELPQVLSREWGDIHPYGNPHIWLDPLNVEKMAENIAAGLEAVDPAHKEEYRENLAAFIRKMNESLFGKELVDEVGSRKLIRLESAGRLDEYLDARGLEDKLGGWLLKARPLKGTAFVTYHKTWIYFAHRFGMRIPVEIEEKPGITPSARHRDQVVRLMRSEGVRLIMLSSFYDRSAADYIARETGATVLSVPIDLHAVKGVDTYFELIDYLIDNMLEAEKGV